MTGSQNEELETAGGILADPKRDLAVRFRALFTLRNISGESAVNCISKVLVEDESALLKHECAYCLGQMQDSSANDILKQVLEDESEHPMVRHEAGEALAAIGSIESLDILKKYSSDPIVEVAQTCQLGVQKIEWEQQQISSGGDPKEKCKSGYESVDPTPPAENIADVQKLRDILMSDDETLFEKYRAMFGLRNCGTEESVKALGEALLKYQNDDSNNLLKHEIAYIFGQMQHEISVPYLKEVLKNGTECEMVRHEAAEALGSIGTSETNVLLESFKKDPVRVVRESIEVALDMNHYQSSEQFQLLDPGTMNSNKSNGDALHPDP